MDFFPLHSYAYFFNLNLLKDYKLEVLGEKIDTTPVVFLLDMICDGGLTRFIQLVYGSVI